MTRLQEDPDFIALKRFEYSLTKLLERYPEEVPANVVASALMLDEEEVEDRYQEIVNKLKELMAVV